MEGMEEEEEKVYIGEGLDQCRQPYKLAMYGEWELLKEFYKNHPFEVVGQLTANNDTVLHVVAFAGCYDVLRFLIDLIDPKMLLMAFSIPNSYGNTILHEVAVSGNREAAELLVEEDKRLSGQGEYSDSSCIRLVEIRNKLGESPLYRAAAFGHTNLVKYFRSEVRDIKPHFKRKDGLSILHTAVIAQNFETAFWLQKEYPDLANTKESNGLTSLQLLAQMPNAFQAESIWRTLIYKCLLDDDNCDSERRSNQSPNQNDDLESGSNQPPNQNDDLDRKSNQPRQSSSSKKITRWRPIRDIFDEIKNQKFLSKLTRSLVEKDYSWVVNNTINENKTFTLVLCPNKSDDPPQKTSESTPLLIATCKGISKIVENMLDSHPQSVDILDPATGRNILHIAIKHRRLEIFNIVRKSKSITSRLAYWIDINGDTILHHAAYVSSYPVDAQRSSGPAFQLQEELRWMARVEKIMPRHYAMHQNNQGLTAQKLFEKEHADDLKSAKTWIKETAQSCSTVAALVATVAYAAAFTAPGGNDNYGVPVLRHSTFFATFAVSDIISLIFSLTSLCTFLSILTSPCEYKNFHHSLPFRLHLGFALLFFSLVSTMLTFTAAVVLLINHQKMWTTSLICVVALLPVSVFGLSQFPLYNGFCRSLKYISNEMKPIISSIIRRVFGFSQS